jgi:hypothetical protein
MFAVLTLLLHCTAAVVVLFRSRLRMISWQLCTSHGAWSCRSAYEQQQHLQSSSAAILEWIAAIVEAQPLLQQPRACTIISSCTLQHNSLVLSLPCSYLKRYTADIC